MTERELQAPAAKRARGAHGTFVIHVNPTNGQAAAVIQEPPYNARAQQSALDPQLATDPAIWGEPYLGPHSRLAVTRGLDPRDPWSVAVDAPIMDPLPNDLVRLVLPPYLGMSHLGMLAGTSRLFYYAMAPWRHPGWFERSGKRDKETCYTGMSMPLRALMEGDIPLFLALTRTRYRAVSIDVKARADFMRNAFTAALCHGRGGMDYLTELFNVLVEKLWPVGGTLYSRPDFLHTFAHVDIGFALAHGADPYVICDLFGVAVTDQRVSLAYVKQLHGVMPGLQEHGRVPYSFYPDIMRSYMSNSIIPQWLPSFGTRCSGNFHFYLTDLILHGWRPVDKSSGGDGLIPGWRHAGGVAAERFLNELVHSVVPFLGTDPVAFPVYRRHLTGSMEHLWAGLASVFVPLERPYNLPAMIFGTRNTWTSGTEVTPSLFAIELADVCRPVFDWLLRVLVEATPDLDVAHVRRWRAGILMQMWGDQRIHTYGSVNVLAQFRADLEDIIRDSECTRDAAFNWVAHTMGNLREAVAIYEADAADPLHSNAGNDETLRFWIHPFARATDISRVPHEAQVRSLRIGLVLDHLHSAMCYYDATQKCYVPLFPLLDVVGNHAMVVAAERDIVTDLIEAYKIMAQPLANASVKHRLFPRLELNSNPMTGLPGIESCVSWALHVNHVRREAGAPDEPLQRYHNEQHADTDANCRRLPYFTRLIVQALVDANWNESLLTCNDMAQRVVEILAYMARLYAHGAYTEAIFQYFLEGIMDKLAPGRGIMREADVAIFGALTTAIRKGILPVFQDVHMVSVFVEWWRGWSHRSDVSHFLTIFDKGSTGLVERGKSVYAAHFQGRLPDTFGALFHQSRQMGGNSSYNRSYGRAARTWRNVVGGDNDDMFIPLPRGPWTFPVFDDPVDAAREFSATLDSQRTLHPLSFGYSGGKNSIDEALTWFDPILASVGDLMVACLPPARRLDILARLATRAVDFPAFCAARDAMHVSAEDALVACAHGTLVLRRSVLPNVFTGMAFATALGQHEPPVRIRLGTDAPHWPTRFTTTMLTRLPFAHPTAVAAVLPAFDVRALAGQQNRRTTTAVTFFGALANLRVYPAALGSLANFWEEWVGTAAVANTVRTHGARWILSLASHCIAYAMNERVPVLTTHNADDSPIATTEEENDAAENSNPRHEDEDEDEESDASLSHAKQEHHQTEPLGPDAMDIDAPLRMRLMRQTVTPDHQRIRTECEALLDVEHTHPVSLEVLVYSRIFARNDIHERDTESMLCARVDWIASHARELSHPCFSLADAVERERAALQATNPKRSTSGMAIQHGQHEVFGRLVDALVARIRHFDTVFAKGVGAPARFVLAPPPTPDETHEAADLMEMARDAPERTAKRAREEPDVSVWSPYDDAQFDSLFDLPFDADTM